LIWALSRCSNSQYGDTFKLRTADPFGSGLTIFVGYAHMTYLIHTIKIGVYIWQV